MVALLDRISSRSTVVKGISIRLLNIIAYRDKLVILFGNIPNIFIRVPCLEKEYVITGPEFSE